MLLLVVVVVMMAVMVGGGGDGGGGSIDCDDRITMVVIGLSWMFLVVFFSFLSLLL